MLKRLEKRIHKKKAGMTSLEMVAALAIFLIMVGFFIDTFTILNQHYVVTKEANTISRQIALQGGVGIYRPTGYDRLGQTYYTSLDFNRRVQDRVRGMKGEGEKMYLRPNEAGVETGWTELTPGLTMSFPYNSSFEFMLEYKYEWKLMGQMIPGMGGKRTRQIQRAAVSETGV